jgi:DNA-binding MarR family transcriptional regulator
MAKTSRKKKPAADAADAPGADAAAARPIDTGVLPELLGYNLRRAQIALWRDFTYTVGNGEVRPGVFSLLMLAELNPGIAQVDLANQLDIDKATIVALVDRLEQRGWVVRRRSTIDRRRQGVHLTDEGKRWLKQLRRDMLEHEKRFTRLFSAAELRQLISLLRRIHP